MLLLLLGTHQDSRGEEEGEGEEEEERKSEIPNEGWNRKKETSYHAHCKFIEERDDQMSPWSKSKIT